jgi:hypothetical protein
MALAARSTAFLPDGPPSEIFCLYNLYKGAREAANLAQGVGAVAANVDNAAESQITAIKTQIETLQNLAPSDERAQLIAAAALQGVNFLQTKYQGIKKDAAVASTAISGLSNFVGAFQDNPGRRLISIYLGALLGLIGAGVCGLDMFRAALGAPLPGPQHLGVVLTGIAIGLGSNPTHEVIKVLLEFKQGQKASNSTPSAA